MRALSIRKYLLTATVLTRRCAAASPGGRGKRTAAAVVLLVAAAAFWRLLPTPLFNDPYAYALYDAHGELLGARIADDGQWRFEPATQVPDKFAQALVAFEDQRYYQHPGIDPLALGRALRSDIRARRIVSGGSTLTMQLARLVRGNPPRSVGEKLADMILALRLEARYGKDELLALYAGHAPFGANVVGLEAAAWRWFGRAPDHLSWAEAATLAVLPNSPALIHPARARDALQRKRDLLLARLHASGRIDAMSYRLALAEPLPDAPRPLPQLAPHLLATLAAQPGTPHRYTSTLSRPLQQSLNRAIAARSPQYLAAGVHNAAALVIDNRTLQVLAYAGNNASPDADADGRGHAVDVIRRPRSTGSTLKPFLYAAMLQDGLIEPSSLVPDVPMHFTGFKPENYDHQYRGAVRAREALAQSLNVPAVAMLRDYGVPRFYDVLAQMGMSTLSRAPDDYGLTLILGGAEATPWDLAQMYANLARIASSGAPRGALRYARARTRVGEPPAYGRASELGAGAAYLTLDALTEVARPQEDREWKNFSSARKLAWKTGTSFGLRDGWAVGVTPRYTAAVWVGNASGEGRAGLTGAGMAAPLLFDIENLLDDRSWFSAPGADLRVARVCRDDGWLPSEDCETEEAWIPVGSHFQNVSRNHQTVHLDATLQRVDSRCESVARMRHASWFVLPPAQEYFYRERHTSYRALPRWRGDCQSVSADNRAQRPFDILYPEAGTTVYIPTELGGARSRVVFEAVHRDSRVVLYWHIDDAFVAQTTQFHKLALDVPPGEHRLTLVDSNGYRQVRSFSVLGKDASERTLAVD